MEAIKEDVVIIGGGRVSTLSTGKERVSWINMPRAS